MKTIQNSFLFTLSLVLVIGLSYCDASKDATKTKKERPEMVYTSVSQLLRNQPGIKLQGVGEDVVVIVRGERSILGNNEPLFILDGIVLGDSYRTATVGLDPNSIASVRVLTPANAGIYGSRGANGVIVFRSKDN